MHLQEHEIERKINLLVANAVGDTKKTSDATTADRIAWRVAYLCSAPTPKAMPAGGAAPNVSNMADVAIRPYSLDLMSICKALIAKDGEHKAIGENLDRWMSPVRMFRIVDEHTSESKLTAELAHESHADDEEFSRVLTQVLANAVLPFCYGILGAGAAVVRDLWAKMKESLLAPRDYTLAVGQLALGAIIGACIGLFISPAVAGAQSDNILGGFVLTGSALSFVAGFGVEGVFLALESLVRRVFNMSDVGKKT